VNTTPSLAPTGDSKLADLAHQNPALHEVLLRHGMDACCGGALTVTQAAAAHQVPLEPLLRELCDAAGV
jgi:iron-sulfur cluster repair protein YtfE (RIC family)